MLKLISLISTCSLLLTACSAEQPSTPSCRIDSRYQENISGNGGCIIRINNKLVTTTLNNSSGYSLPILASTVNNTAQCNAHLNVWFSTGFNPEVGKYLGTSKKGERLYECKLEAGFDGQIEHFDIPLWANKNVKSIQLIDPYAISFRQWHDDEELAIIRAFFNQTY
jgi:hypothetical protein